jgi:anti-sigma factor RsiW
MSKPNPPPCCRPEQLTLFHYGDLDAADRLRVETHLQDCAACRRELAQLRATLAALPKSAAEFSPQEIRAFNARVGLSLQPRRPFYRRPALGWSLAAATAMLLVVSLHGPLRSPSRPPSGVVLHVGGPAQRLPDTELLLNMDLLENLDLLQQLDGTGIEG